LINTLMGTFLFFKGSVWHNLSEKEHSHAQKSIA